MCDTATSNLMRLAMALHEVRKSFGYYLSRAAANIRTYFEVTHCSYNPAKAKKIPFTTGGTGGTANQCIQLNSLHLPRLSWEIPSTVREVGESRLSGVNVQSDDRKGVM